MFVNILGSIMKFCYNLFSNYGLAIILFTIISKIVLLPLSILVQKNSIKMVKMQPAINKIKIDFFGDKDKIADEEAALYKKEKYNAFTSLIPLAIQIILLIGLVEVINHPLTHIVSVKSDDRDKLVEIALKNNEDLEEGSSSLELEVYKDIKNDRNVEEYKTIIDDKKVEEIKNIDMNFFGFDLSWVAVVEKGLAIWVPIIAGLSA